MKKTIVLINGKKRSGKDFSASMLEEKLDSTLKLSFATPLKQIVADTFGITLEALEEFKNNHTEYDIKCMAYPNNQPQVNFLTTDFREILQRFGTEGMKPVFGTDVWAKIALDLVKESKEEVIIIPDFRFNIESDVIKNNPFGINVVTLKIKNDDVDGGEDLHASERELDSYLFDYIIDNTGYSEDLSDYLDSFINTHLVNL